MYKLKVYPTVLKTCYTSFKKLCQKWRIVRRNRRMRRTRRIITMRTIRTMRRMSTVWEGLVQCEKVEYSVRRMSTVWEDEYSLRRLVQFEMVEIRVRKMKWIITGEIVKKDEYRVRWMSEYMMRRMRMMSRMGKMTTPNMLPNLYFICMLIHFQWNRRINKKIKNVVFHFWRFYEEQF